MHNRPPLPQQVERQAKRLKKAEKERLAWLGQTVYVGTLGVVLVLPPVLGAYLGQWLDSALSGYSMRWTLSLILLGVVVGGVNVYLLVRK